MTVEGGVAVGMVDHQVVRSGSVFQGIHLGDDAISDCHNRSAASSGEIDTEMKTLSCRVGRFAPEESTDRVAVWLDHQPCAGSGRGVEWQAEWRAIYSLGELRGGRQ